MAEGRRLPLPLGEWKYIEKGEIPDMTKPILAWTIYSNYMILKDYKHEGKYRNVWTGNVVSNVGVFDRNKSPYEKIVAWVYLDEDAHYVAPTRDGNFIPADKVVEYDAKREEEAKDEVENG